MAPHQGVLGLNHRNTSTNIYGKNSLKIFFSKISGRIIMKLNSALPITVPCLAHHMKNFNVKLSANAANANTDAGGITIALPGLRPGKLKMRTQ